MKADKLFLDANILFSVAYGSPGLDRLWKLSKKGHFELIASQYVIEEAKRNLDQEHLDKLKGYLSKLTVVAEADPSIPYPIDLPDKDSPVLMAAIAAYVATHWAGRTWLGRAAAWVGRVAFWPVVPIALLSLTIQWFERPTLMSRGDDKCRFQFTRKDEPR